MTSSVAAATIKIIQNHAHITVRSRKMERWVRRSTNEYMFIQRGGGSTKTKTVKKSFEFLFEFSFLIVYCILQEVKVKMPTFSEPPYRRTVGPGSTVERIYLMCNGDCLLRKHAPASDNRLLEERFFVLDSRDVLIGCEYLGDFDTSSDSEVVTERENENNSDDEN